MKIKLASYLALALLPLAPAQQIRAQQIHRENTEWCDAWMPNMNASDRPRVMLIGDSITRAYFTAVERALKDQAYVARIATSKALGDPALLDEINTFLKQARFDIVHVNIGMHGWAYSEDDYRRALPDLIAAIRRAAPGAKLIWASTTPVRKDREGGAANARIEMRNTIAREYAAAHEIPIDDLHALMTPHADLHSDDIHFNPQGSDLLAAQVAREIVKLLPR
jgi:hypothetical protein